jgi:UDP-N-acetylglucosamine acyltransferase
MQKGLNNMVHKTAIIDPKAEIGADVFVGPYTVIEEDVIISDGTKIGPHAYIASGTRIGKNCQVHHGAVVGTVPQDLKFENEKTTLEIGDNTIIREFASLNRGTKDKWKTVVGSNCLVMMYVHIAHDCEIGNNVILANSVNIAGHVVIEDFVSIGGLVPVHQFVRIGKHSFIGGGWRVPKDVPPYILASGEPMTYTGLNIVGLKRRGFTDAQLEPLKKTYKLFYRSGLNTTQALERIKQEVEMTKEVKDVIEFIEKSERGVVKR